MNYKEEINNICEQYKTSELYSTIVDRAELLVSKIKRKEYIIGVLKENSEDLCKNDPEHMLGTINLLIQMHLG